MDLSIIRVEGDNCQSAEMIQNPSTLLCLKHVTDSAQEVGAVGRGLQLRVNDKFEAYGINPNTGDGWAPIAALAATRSLSTRSEWVCPAASIDFASFLAGGQPSSENTISCEFTTPSCTRPRPCATGVSASAARVSCWRRYDACRPLAPADSRSFGRAAASRHVGPRGGASRLARRSWPQDHRRSISEALASRRPSTAAFHRPQSARQKRSQPAR